MTLRRPDRPRTRLDPEVVAELGYHGPRDRDYAGAATTRALLARRDAEIDAAVREGLRRTDFMPSIAVVMARRGEVELRFLGAILTAWREAYPC